MVDKVEAGAVEQLRVVQDSATGLTGAIAIHSTALGPAAGGCRFWTYSSYEDLVRDAVRLAKGMSYKNALANLPFGGGKAVLQRPTGAFDRDALFRAFGDAVAGLNGAYITAEDVGTTVADMKAIKDRTAFVAGLDHGRSTAGGDPSPWTALGVFESMKAAARLGLGVELSELSVAVQGLGNVGARLCRMLAEAGAGLVVADVDADRAASLAGELGAKAVDAAEIVAAEADVFAPCALGGILNSRSIPTLHARLICGGANNQLETEADGEGLRERGILYAPDYVVNAGGIINVSAEYLGETSEQVAARVHEIAPRLAAILKDAQASGRPSNVVADELARSMIAAATRKAA